MQITKKILALLILSLLPFEWAKASIPFDIPNNVQVNAEYRKFFTKAGKRQLQIALQRKMKHQAFFDELLEKYEIPEVLLAIPYVESGFYSFPRSKRKPYTAGAWQMIPETARLYGLVVNSKIDQRLDLDLETEAALKLLRGMYDELQDWQLTILAYNSGLYKVRKGLEKTRNPDVWAPANLKLFRANIPYLSKVLAAAKILSNRNLLAELELFDLLPYQPTYLKLNKNQDCDPAEYRCFAEMLLQQKNKNKNNS